MWKYYAPWIEDDWKVSKRLTLNLGLRWDYESNMLDNNFVLPADIVAGLSGKVDPAYLSNDRKPIKTEFQPRVGFTYDLRGDSKYAIFGGAGRYYDRLYLNAAMEERFRIQFRVDAFNVFNHPNFTGLIKMEPASFFSGIELTSTPLLV